MIARRALLALGLACLAAAPSAARTHRVRSGETLQEIAKAEFGDAGLAELLGLHNGLAPGSRLRADARLDLPEGRVLRVMRPQTFADLAERTLGSRTYAPLLAALNRRDVSEPLGFGMQIIVPALLDHRVAHDEDLASIAALFYGDPTRTWALELANPTAARTVKVPVVGFFRESLGAGEVDLVRVARKHMARGTQAASAAKPPGGPEPPAAAPDPAAAVPGAPAPPAIVGLATASEPPGGVPRSASQVRAASPSNSPSPVHPRASVKPPAAAIERIEAGPAGERARPGSDARGAVAAEPEAPPAKPASVHVDAPRPAIPDRIPWPPLEEARRAVQDGDYHRAQVDITALLDARRVPRDLRPQAWLLLGLSRLARGESEPARAAFAQARKLNPSMQLDPYFYSPKVRAAFTTANAP